MVTEADTVVAELSRQIGLKIAELRRGVRLTQEQLAERLEVSPQWLRQIETGREHPSLVTMVKIALALDVTVKDLFESPASMQKSKPGRPRRPG